jgi:hypothetical protein
LFVFVCVHQITSALNMRVHTIQDLNSMGVEECAKFNMALLSPIPLSEECASTFEPGGFVVACTEPAFSGAPLPHTQSFYLEADSIEQQQQQLQQQHLQQQRQQQQHQQQLQQQHLQQQRQQQQRQQQQQHQQLQQQHLQQQRQQQQRQQQQQQHLQQHMLLLLQGSQSAGSVAIDARHQGIIDTRGVDVQIAAVRKALGKVQEKKQGEGNRGAEEGGEGEEGWSMWGGSMSGNGHTERSVRCNHLRVEGPDGIGVAPTRAQVGAKVSQRLEVYL